MMTSPTPVQLNAAVATLRAAFIVLEDATRSIFDDAEATRIREAIGLLHAAAAPVDPATASPDEIDLARDLFAAVGFPALRALHKIAGGTLASETPRH